MNARTFSISLLTIALTVMTGCKGAPGKPHDGDETARPEQVTDFKTLYKQNCAACHGDEGRRGAAISLANPVYLAYAGEANIERITAAGVHGTMMPPFSKDAGGMLTAEQIAALSKGMIAAWGDQSKLGGQTPPAYASTTKGDPAQGEKSFGTSCARCHGADGSGMASGKMHTGSLIDPAYLALVSDQGLRSLIIAGQPEDGMPDWKSDLQGHAMSDQEIADTVAWLTSHRIATPGQPYQPHE
jgi:mono/diheme cytochrome c family protein